MTGAEFDCSLPSQSYQYLCQPADLLRGPGLSRTCFGRDSVQQECSAQGLWVLVQSTADTVLNGRLNGMTEAETQTVASSD